jgi:hypothetical protein
MATVRQILLNAGRKLDLDDMTPDELMDGMGTLNSMLAHFSASNLIAPATTRQSFTLSAGSDEYTVGSGGDIDISWPQHIIAATVNDGSRDIPLKPFSAVDYAYTGDKTTDNVPAAIYYERSYPLGNFLFWPGPDSSYTVKLYYKYALGGYTDLYTEVELPPEYQSMVEYNLAVELSPEYDIAQINPVVLKKAITSVKAIKRLNSKPVPMISTDPFHRGSGNSDWLFDTGAPSGGGFVYSFPFTLL